jgi:hypothetical protein
VAPEKIKLESRLLHDLGINGDDAEYLLMDYSKTFHVDMSEFNFWKFFMGEPNLFNFWKFWFGDKRRFAP